MSFIDYVLHLREHRGWLAVWGIELAAQTRALGVGSTRPSAVQVGWVEVTATARGLQATSGKTKTGGTDCLSQCLAGRIQRIEKL